MTRLFHFLLSFSFIFLVSCASREAGWEQKTSEVAFSKGEVENLKKEALNFWKGRVEKANLEQALSRFELIHAAQPEDLETLVYLTRGYYFLADSHIDEADLKKTNYEKAASFGEKAMATNKNFKDKVAAGEPVEKALDTLTVKEVPAIYWTAASLGKWAKSSGIAAQLKYKTRIKGMIERVETLEPDFFYGAAPRYWGGFYAVAPSFAGGDMKKSYANFVKSLGIAPGYLGTRVLMAEVYWTKEGNKREFEKELRYVLDANENIIPELKPENTLEKKKAEKLLSQIDELF